MSSSRLCIVSATTNLKRAQSCITSWLATAQEPPILVLIGNGPDAMPNGVEDLPHQSFSIAWKTSDEYLGTVPAFKMGVDVALDIAGKIDGPPIVAVAALHDDLEIHHQDWDQKVLKHFERHPSCGLLGFGGAIGLGADGLYDKPYDPMSLARIGFRSNLVDAENHGIRSLLPERIAVLDGFSQVGRREFWEGWGFNRFQENGQAAEEYRPWNVLERLGVVHHFQDGALGCIAARHGWQTWYLPIRCTHYGGRTAVGDQGYQAWAKSKTEKGDQGFWEAAHKACYEEFRDCLPIRL